MVVFPFCPAWVSRPVERAWVCSSPIVPGGSAQPEPLAVEVKRLSLRLHRQCSCPGYLASPSVPREGALLWISPVTSEVCGRLGYCHVDWLERCAFGVCTRVAQTYARATCANSHSQDQVVAFSWVPSSLTSDLCLFLPDHRPHVSISSGFPRGVGFLGNPAHKSLRVVPYSSYRPAMRATCELLRSHDLFCAPVGGCYPPRILMSERPEFYSSCLITDPLPFWFKPISLFGLVEFTMVQMHLQLPSP